MTTTTTEPRIKVIDCPAYAWDNSDQPAIVDLRERYGFEWVAGFRDDIDQAAYDLIRDHLLVEWRARGFEPDFTDDKAAFEADSYHPAPTDPPNATYWQLWDEAAYAITADELLDKANLRAYAR
jgi:hypothetical protein